MVYLKTFESYSGVDEWADELFQFLRKYNLFPEQERKLREFYWPSIEEWYSNGKYSRECAEMIAKELQLTTGGFPTYKSPLTMWQNIYYR